MTLDHAAKAREFAALHVKGAPLILYNIWDAGGAKAVAEAGAKAIATGSWSVAAAHGFKDGEAIPLDFVETIVRRITASVELPVTVDFEGAYSADPGKAATNVARMLAAGAAGINLEDQIVGTAGLHSAADQGKRISAIRRVCDDHKIPFFINARTDLFLKAPAPEHAALMADAKARALAYRDAGASGFFAPGLIDEKLIAELCTASPLPVNIMVRDGVPPNAILATLGVSRISYGPRPYGALMAMLRDAAKVAYPQA
jgi:2-methylisocitrate lyase-like PEP mutase family enzyme